MARFRKVDPRIWNDAKFASLSGEAKLMFLYLLTSPSMTVLGALPMRASAVAEELGLDSERYGKRYQELYQRGMVEYDSRGLFWVRNYMKYNGPDNPKVVISWSSALDLLPECPLLYKVLESARNHCVSRGKGFPKAFNDTLGNCLQYGMPYGMPYKEKEKEKEKEYLDVYDETSSSANANASESVEEDQTDLFDSIETHPVETSVSEKGVAAATVGRTPAPKNGQTESKPLSGLEHHPAPKVAPNPADAHPEIASETPQIGESDPADAPAPKSAKRNPPVPYQKVVDLYNAKCTPALAAARLTDKRKDDIRKRWHEMQEYTGAKTEEETLEAFGTLFDRVAHSDYLKGLVNGFKADFPWLMQREKFEFVLGGRYDNREHAAIERNGSRGTSPLPAHLNPRQRFDAAYYADAKKPDGTTDWGV